MFIYVPEVFDSLKLFEFDESQLEPWERSNKKEFHPMYGQKRPDLAERNRQRKGTKWPKGIPHFNQGRVHSEETKNKHKILREGRKHSSETIMKMQIAAKLREADPAIKALRSAASATPISIKGIQYSSKKEAMKILNINWH